MLPGANIEGAQYIKKPAGVARTPGRQGFYLIHLVWRIHWSRRQGITNRMPQIFKRTSWWKAKNAIGFTLPSIVLT